MSTPPASRWRWRPGLFACTLGVLAGVWLVVLNSVAVAGTLPYVQHGSSVAVTVRSCGAHGCRGDYRLGARVLVDQPVDGATRKGTVQATVDARHPGTAVTGDQAEALAEQLVLGLAGLLLALASLRAATRAVRERREEGAPPDLTEL